MIINFIFYKKWIYLYPLLQKQYFWSTQNQIIINDVSIFIPQLLMKNMTAKWALTESSWLRVSDECVVRPNNSLTSASLPVSHLEPRSDR